MVKTYQFDSTIQEDGVIMLPKSLYSLRKHHVRFIVIDLEPHQDDPVAWLEKITQEYAAITDEEGLSLDEIYAQREQSHERTFLFD